MGKIYSVRDNSNEVRDSNSNKKRYSLGSNFVQNSRSKEKDVLTIDFSPRLMAFIIIILAFLFYAKQILVITMFIFFAFVVMSSIKPVVNWLKARGLPKGTAITIAYVVLFILIQSILFLVFVPFVNQLAGLVSTLPKWVEESLLFLEDFSIGGFRLNVEWLNDYIATLLKELPSANNVKNIAGFISNFFGMGAFLVTSLIFSIYLVAEHDSFFDILLIRIVSDEKRERVKKLVLDVERKLGGWVLGQAVVSTLSGTFCVVVLSILGVPFALPLAIFTGFLGVIPNLGSTLAGIVMALVALIAVGPLAAIILLGAFILYQPLENTVITPKVMGNAVGLKPMIVMLGVIIFLILFGILGGFVAVPLMVIIKILYEFYIDLQKLKAKGIV
jgi:predicted PurR-regulated permease PerM